MTLTRGTVTEPASSGRELGIRDWLGDRREITVGDGAASYLTTYENFNDGWKATLNGRELTPVRLDGWQQGWRVPGGAGGAVKLSYEPSVTYEAGHNLDPDEHSKQLLDRIPHSTPQVPLNFGTSPTE